MQAWGARSSKDTVHIRKEAPRSPAYCHFTTWSGDAVDAKIADMDRFWPNNNNKCHYWMYVEECNVSDPLFTFLANSKIEDDPLLFWSYCSVGQTYSLWDNIIVIFTFISECILIFETTLPFWNTYYLFLCAVQQRVRLGPSVVLCFRTSLASHWLHYILRG